MMKEISVSFVSGKRSQLLRTPMPQYLCSMARVRTSGIRQSLLQDSDRKAFHPFLQLRIAMLYVTKILFGVH